MRNIRTIEIEIEIFYLFIHIPYYKSKGILINETKEKVLKAILLFMM